MRNGCLTLCQFSIPADVVGFNINLTPKILNLTPKIRNLTPKSLNLTLIFPISFFKLFEYERLVRILLHGVSDTEQSFVQRIAIYLLNSLACQVDGIQKLFLGDLGAISVSFFYLLVEVLY